ncbi:MAG: hypothetical protein H0W72_01845 [Planctomycetes bacterium]|nr:hypothetical protein [Planctomycetota bacterium]
MPLALALVAFLVASQVVAAQEQTVVIATPQTAGIDGRYWDKTFPGAMTVDAVHRSVLMRFPGAADQIAAKLVSGLRLSKATVVLELGEVELGGAPGYTMRVNTDVWKADPPRWHVVAWALRRPWEADEKRGPTFNAWLNGAGYWQRYGAADSKGDRHEQPIGQTELSHAQPKGEIDVTTCLTGSAFGKDAGARLRAWEDHGLLLRKLEAWDARYMRDGNAYEWNVPNGPCGIRIQAARLEVAFTPGGDAKITLPPAVTLDQREATLRADGPGGGPTAVMPTAAEVRAIAETFRPRKPQWMPDWQWQRMEELRTVGGGEIFEWAGQIASGDPARYQALVDTLLACPPRYWKGWDVQSDLLLWYLYRDALPQPVRDHLQAYWRSWLHPDVPGATMFHPHDAGSTSAWYDKTGDWRGNSSFFRAAYCYGMSTMNFNHTASMGALLGGGVIGAKEAISDGRFGLDHLLLRLWAYLDGNTQEMLDHYYYSITQSAQKMFVDFAPGQADRLRGRMILDRSIELIASAYHPNLRRCVHPGGRARTSGVMVEQDGIYSVLHTLSRKGVLNYLDQPMGTKIHEMNLWGHDFPPGRAALQTLPGAWAEEWVAGVIDEKQLPWWQVSTESVRNGFRNPPLWRTVFLGRHYGLGCADVTFGSFPIVAQWNRKAETVRQVEDLGTMLVRFAINTPDLVGTSGGLKPLHGYVGTFQYKNRAIICSKPLADRDSVMKEAGGKLQEMSTNLGLFNLRRDQDWEWYIDGTRVISFPVALKAGQLITIGDGVSYLAIIPLPTTDLGRKDEITIGPGGGGVPDHGSGGRIEPMLISSRSLQLDAPLDADKADWQRICRGATGGFVIEMADSSEYPDIAAFHEHMRDAKVQTRWSAEESTLHVTYESSGDTMAMGFGTTFGGGDVHSVIPPGDQGKMFRYRTVNGEPAYLPTGIERDTPLVQQGSTGRLEKNGAVLANDPGRMAYLQTEPASGTYVAYSIVPDPTATWAFTVPGGMAITADGRVGLLRLMTRPAENRIWVDDAGSPEQGSAFMATALVVRGVAKAPTVMRNGKDVTAECRRIELDGKPAFCIPLGEGLSAKDAEMIPQRLQIGANLTNDRRAREATLITDWMLAGPFPSASFNGHEIAYAPESGVDLAKGWKDATGLKPWKAYQPNPNARPLNPTPPRTVNVCGQFARDDEAVGYAYTRLVSDRDRDAYFLMGTDDCVKVWCNGALVHEHRVGRGVTMDQDACRVRLRKGANDVLIKVTQGGGGWGFCLRVTDEFGVPLGDAVRAEFKAP